jgi:hypothetical protein
MSKLTSGILGPLKGKIGGVVGSTWKGIPVLKTKPASVANPRTSAQVTQRNAFSAVVALARLILVSIIKPLNDRFAQGQSGFNQFVSRNIGNWDGNLLMTPEDIEIARGVLQPIDDLAAVQGATIQEIVLTWTDNTGDGDALATDEVYVMVLNADNMKGEGFSNVNMRDDGTATITLDGTVSDGDEMHVYVAMKRADNTKVSSTSYSTYSAAA